MTGEKPRALLFDRARAMDFSDQGGKEDRNQDQHQEEGECQLDSFSPELTGQEHYRRQQGHRPRQVHGSDAVANPRSDDHHKQKRIQECEVPRLKIKDGDQHERIENEECIERKDTLATIGVQEYPIGDGYQEISRDQSEQNPAERICRSAGKSIHGDDEYHNETADYSLRSPVEFVLAPRRGGMRTDVSGKRLQPGCEVHREAFTQ